MVFFQAKYLRIISDQGFKILHELFNNAICLRNFAMYYWCDFFFLVRNRNCDNDKCDDNNKI
jgi:hypothetical protein